MIFILGILTGLTLATLTILTLLWARPKVERSLRQLESKVMAKGSIIEPENEELKNWIDNLKQE